MRFLWLGVLALAGCGSAEEAPFARTGAIATATGGASGSPATGGVVGSGGQTGCAGGDTRECLGPGACRGAQACGADGWNACDCGMGSGGLTGAGGAVATGGVVSSGGAPATGGVVGTGGADPPDGHVPGTPPCASDEKECFGVCQKPWPATGCTEQCSPCPAAPAGGQPICGADGRCSFECLLPYLKGPDIRGEPTCLAPIQCDGCGGIQCDSCPATSRAPCCCRGDTGGCGCIANGSCG